MQQKAARLGGFLMDRQSSKRVIPSQRPRPASLAAKGSLVIARPVRRLVVAIRWPFAAIHLLRTLTTSSWRRRSLRTCVCAEGVGVGIRSPVKMSVTMQFLGNTDCHTSDVGHWFAMTETDVVSSLQRAIARCNKHESPIAKCISQWTIIRSHKNGQENGARVPGRDRDRL